MYYAVICTDRPGRLDVRIQNRPAHIEYLKANADKVMAGGAFTQEDGETMCGSLLIVEADSLQAAEEFARNDPFAKAGLFESVAVRPWIWRLGRIMPE